MDERPKIKILKKGTPKGKIPTAPRPEPKVNIDESKTGTSLTTQQEIHQESEEKSESESESVPQVTRNTRDKTKKFKKVVQSTITHAIVVLLTVCLCYLLWGNTNSDDNNIINEIVPNITGTKIIEPEFMIKAKEKGFILKKDILRARMTFEDLLNQEQVQNRNAVELNRLAQNAGVDQLYSGDKITIYYDSVYTDEAKYIFIEQKGDPYNYYSFNLDDDLAFDLTRKHIELRKVKESSVIERNLAQTFNKNKLDDALAIFIENAFKWRFDLFRLRPGDRFKIIYEREFINDKAGEIKKVNAILFEVGRDRYYAFNYSRTNEALFYDENGKTLKSLFLKSPIEYGGIITSGFGLRVHPIEQKSKMHRGTDYAAHEGTEIIAVADGRISIASETKNNGHYVKIRHNNTYETQYLHMQKPPPVRRGDYVKQGDVIGYVGSTGLASGPHVCFRFWKNGKEVDHLQESPASGTSISRNEIDNYLNEIKNLKAEIDNINYF